MPRIFYDKEEDAQKAANLRKREVFKFCEGSYFVGTYDQATKRLQKKALFSPKRIKSKIDGGDANK